MTICHSNVDFFHVPCHNRVNISIYHALGKGEIVEPSVQEGTKDKVSCSIKMAWQKDIRFYILYFFYILNISKAHHRNSGTSANSYYRSLTLSLQGLLWFND